jgi:hypothetical protein
MVTLTKVGYSFTVGPLVVRLKRRASGDTAETEEWRGEAAEGRSTLLVPRLPRGEYTLELREPSNAAPPPRRLRGCAFFSFAALVGSAGAPAGAPAAASPARPAPFLRFPTSLERVAFLGRGSAGRVHLHGDFRLVPDASHRLDIPLRTRTRSLLRMHVLTRAPQPLTLLVFRRTSDGAEAAAAGLPGGGGSKGGSGGGKGGSKGGKGGWSLHARSEWAKLGGETMGEAAEVNTSRTAHEARLQLLAAELPPGDYVLRLAFYDANAPGGGAEPPPLLGPSDAARAAPAPGAALGSGLLQSLWSVVYSAFGGGGAQAPPEQAEVEVNAELSVAPLAQLTREQEAEESSADRSAVPPLLDACDPERADAPLPAPKRRRGSHTFVQRGTGLTISSATLQRGGPLQAEEFFVPTPAALHLRCEHSFARHALVAAVHMLGPHSEATGGRAAGGQGAPAPVLTHFTASSRGNVLELHRTLAPGSYRLVLGLAYPAPADLGRCASYDLELQVGAPGAAAHACGAADALPPRLGASGLGSVELGAARLRVARLELAEARARGAAHGSEAMESDPVSFLVARPSVLRVLLVASSAHTEVIPVVTPGGHAGRASALGNPTAAAAAAAAAAAHPADRGAATFVLAAAATPYRLVLRYAAIDPAETCPSLALALALEPLRALRELQRCAPRGLRGGATQGRYALPSPPPRLEADAAGRASFWGRVMLHVNGSAAADAATHRVRFDVVRPGAVLVVRATQDVALGALHLALHAASDAPHGVPLARASLSLTPRVYQREGTVTRGSEGQGGREAHYVLRAELSAGSYELRLAPQREPRAALPTEALRSHYCVTLDLDAVLAPRAAPPFVRTVEREEPPPPDARSTGFRGRPASARHLALLVRLSAAAHINGAAEGLRPIDARPAARTPQARGWASLQRVGGGGARLWPHSVRFMPAEPSGSLLWLSFDLEAGGSAWLEAGSNGSLELQLHGALIARRGGKPFQLPPRLGRVRAPPPPAPPPPDPFMSDEGEREYGEDSYGANSALSPGLDEWADVPRARGGGVGVDDDARDDDDDGEDDDGDDDDDADGAGGCSADSHCGCEEGAAARRGVINCTPLGRCTLHATSGAGACECRRGFAGDECGVCAKGFVGFPPKCAPAKACARDCGRGTCELATGECRCPAQYGGPQCAECAAGFGGPSCLPTARVTDLGWQPTKGDIQRTDSGWQPIGAASRHVTSSSVLPQARAAHARAHALAYRHPAYP